MTLAETIYQRSLTLPDAAAQEALDFIEFLTQRYGIAESVTGPNSDATAYDAWFTAEVQQALDDSRPAIPTEMVREHFAARRDVLRQQAQAK